MIFLRHVKLICRTPLGASMYVVFLAVVSFAQLSFAETPLGPHGALFRTLFGDNLEKKYNIGVMGYAHISAARSNHDIEKTLLPQGRG